MLLAMGPTCWPTSGWDLGDLKIWLGPSYVQKIAPFNHPNYIIRGPHVQSIWMGVQSIQVDSNGCKLMEHVYKGDGFFGPTLMDHWVGPTRVVHKARGVHMIIFLLSLCVCLCMGNAPVRVYSTTLR